MHIFINYVILYVIFKMIINDIEIAKIWNALFSLSSFAGWNAPRIFWWSWPRVIAMKSTVNRLRCICDYAEVLKIWSIILPDSLYHLISLYLQENTNTHTHIFIGNITIKKRKNNKQDRNWIIYWQIDRMKRISLNKKARDNFI